MRTAGGTPRTTLLRMALRWGTMATSRAAPLRSKSARLPMQAHPRTGALTLPPRLQAPQQPAPRTSGRWAWPACTLAPPPRSSTPTFPMLPWAAPLLQTFAQPLCPLPMARAQWLTMRTPPLLSTLGRCMAPAAGAMMRVALWRAAMWRQWALRSTALPQPAQRMGCPTRSAQRRPPAPLQCAALAGLAWRWQGFWAA